MVTNWLAELDGRRVVVEVPASSANLGAGYDCIGVALGLTNRIEVEVRGWSRGEMELSVEGEGQGELEGNRDNRCVLGIEAALREVRGELPDGIGWRIEMHNEIPLARGLGSSAAATVGGLVAGNALLGGFTVSAPIDGGVEALRFDAPRDLRAVLFIPDLRLPTDEMRAVLPAKVPLVDAVANLTRVAVGVAGMATGRFDLLRVLTVDRLHEQYRAKVYPQLPQLVESARKAGAIGACLSGAGSTVLAFSDSVRTITRIEAAFGAAAADTDLTGRIAVVSFRNNGAQVVKRG